ncbi:MAG: PSD1 and planctomycete cytochrome C domain-containing protein, partial [Isosphaeraceae bacterium]
MQLPTASRRERIRWPGPRFVRALGAILRLGAIVAVVVVGAIARGDEPGKQREGVDFFESKVRPVLVEHCFQCHSAGAKSVKGGLRLDSLDGMKKGGDTGPAVVPGDVDASLLVQAVRYGDEQMKMPPKGRLPDATIAALEGWVRSGAAMPHGVEASAGKATARKKPPGTDFEAARSHWAYQPIRRPAIPEVKHPEWARAAIDRFILARLEVAGLTPSPPADRRTLLRRVHFDLVGLPPTSAEIEAFAKDPAPDAFERVVDRLLASPRYGERWGRHWMDVARYADTKDGVLMFGDDRVRPYSYTYRDYAIRAFNEDLGFDQFVADQLAADVLAPRTQPWRLAAMGLLTLGKGFDNNIHDQIDDRIDVVTRGFLGLTVACARCHDHKYDAIPTADYYSLYGVFASTEVPLELPLTDPEAARRRPSEFEKKAEAKRQEIRAFLDGQYRMLSSTARNRTPDYLVRVATTAPDPLETAIFFFSLAPEDLRPQMVARWRRFVRERSRPDDPVFGPWHDLMALADADYPVKARAVVHRWRATRPAGTTRGQLNPLVAEALGKAELKSRADVARVYGELIRRVDDQARKSAPATSASVAQEDESRRQLRSILADRESPSYFPESHTYYYMSRGEKDAYGGKLVELDRMIVKAADPWPRAMVVNDADEPYEPRIFVRGNPSQPGQHIPRQFLRVLAGPGRQPFAHGSGRGDLARAITAPNNPLTARVIVNRVWMHHFGEPLVGTPSDFGTRSTPPSHPELLDYLADRLRSEGWSLKALHRQIVLSSAYQQASRDRPECRKVDPENRLLWHVARRRLDLESMRDALLFVSGRLDGRMGGRPVDVAGDPANRRRTVYGMVDRQSLPAMFRAFDFASPDQSAERRPRTTVPQQALFSMNAPFVIEQARALAARDDVARASTPAGRIDALDHAVHGRRATEAEIAAASLFVVEPDRLSDPSGRSRLTRWEQLAQVLL